MLVKPLSKPLARLRNISAATVLGSGKVVPILNVQDLLKSATQTGADQRRTVAVSKTENQKAKSILVAEDSITSRMLLQSILQGAGYRVETAVDGAEAFSALKTGDFSLLVSDVQMPRMEGFELTSKIRNDKALSDLPVVLVTALGSAEDKLKGVESGANAYIVKSSFDQSNLLDVVRRLI